MISDFSLSFYPIDLKPWHYDPCVLRFIALIYLRITILDLFRIFWITMYVLGYGHVYIIWS